jgi:hypothetical protein
MKLAIVTCQELPQGVADDLPLLKALELQGFDISHQIWNQPVDWAAYDACLLRSVWDYHDHPAAFNLWLQDISQQTRLINDPRVVRWNQHKGYLQELQDFGITMPPTLWLNGQSSDQSWQAWLEDNPASLYFLKPLVGADSAGTLKFSPDQAGLVAANQHLQAWLPKGGMMLQPFIETVQSFGETSAIYFGGDFSHAVRKIPQAGDYRVQDTFGATDVAYELTPGEMALCKACLQYLNLMFGTLPYARFDFLHDEQGDVFLNEAELIEPSLFFSHGGEAAARKMASAVNDYLSPAEESESADD